MSFSQPQPSTATYSRRRKRSGARVFCCASLERFLGSSWLARTCPNPVTDEEAEELDLHLTSEALQIVAGPVSEVLNEIEWSRIEGDLHESVMDPAGRHGPIGV